MCGREPMFLVVNAHMFLCFYHYYNGFSRTHHQFFCCFWIASMMFKNRWQMQFNIRGASPASNLWGRADHAATTPAVIYAFPAFVQLDFQYTAHNTICFSKPCGICHGNIRHAQSFQIPCHILSTANMAITVQNNMADQAYLT